MATIRQGNLFTLINVFSVKPENQQPLIDLLVDAVKQTMLHLPGFVSSSLHQSDDGKFVVNYVQWRRREDFEAMLRDPEALLHTKAAAALTENYNPITCQVAATMETEETHT